MNRLAASFAAATSAVFVIAAQTPLQADTFGSGASAFTIDFVDIGNSNNAADTSGYGRVPYDYRISVYEISQDQIAKATAGGLANVATGPWTGSQPAANISWLEAAAFVNWLNTNSGYQAAYDLVFTSGQWAMNLWASTNAWTNDPSGGTNFYRHKKAFYFLPSDNEWYKSAYYKTNYFLYPTGRSNAPTPVASGSWIYSGNAVYGQPLTQGPAAVDVAGSLSPYGTAGQGGNVREWMETAFDGTNNSASENRGIRGGSWSQTELALRSTTYTNLAPTNAGSDDLGFRVASVAKPLPEIEPTPTPTPRPSPTSAPSPVAVAPVITARSSVITTTANYTLKLTLSDDNGPSRLKYRLKLPRGKRFGNWTDRRVQRGVDDVWSLKLKLPKRGRWQIQVQAFDTDGNASAIRTITVKRR